MLTLSLVSADDPPVTTEECRQFCRLFDNSHDGNLNILRDAAIEFIEGQLREQIRLRKWRLTATAGEIVSGLVFPKWPVLEVTKFSIGGVDQSLTGLVINSENEPATLEGTLPTGTGTQVLEWRAGASPINAARKLLILQVTRDHYFENELAIGTKLLLESENKHIDAVRG